MDWEQIAHFFTKLNQEDHKVIHLNRNDGAPVATLTIEIESPTNYTRTFDICQEDIDVNGGGEALAIELLLEMKR